jgi:hypothetical protein
VHMFKRIFSIVALLGLVAACGRVDKIYSVENAELGAPPSATMEQVGQAIERAATGLGWTVAPERPGAMIATLDVRTHKAVIRIAYDTKRFSIAYRDSVNLKYDGTDIHYRYNSWIRNLRNEIEKEAAAIRPGT